MLQMASTTGVKEKVASISSDHLTKIPVVKGTFKIRTGREAQEKPGLT